VASWQECSAVPSHSSIHPGGASRCARRPPLQRTQVGPTTLRASAVGLSRPTEGGCPAACALFCASIFYARVCGQLGFCTPPTLLRLPMRAPKSKWSGAELAVLRHLLQLYGFGAMDYANATCLFTDRTVDDIKKRCVCIRDQDRRKARTQEPTSPCSVVHLPYAGELHPSVVWVPPTGLEIGPMNL